MESVQIALLISILSLLFSIVIPVIVSRRLSEVFKQNISDSIDYTKQIEDLVNTELPNIKRAHSIMGSIGNETKEVRKAERQLQLDLMSQELGIDVDQGIELLKEFSPRVGEMVEKNPDLLAQLAPKILKYVNKNKNSPEQSTLTGASKAWT